MKDSITQELDYGCGVACFAFVCDVSFKKAISMLGREYSIKHGWKPSDLVKALNGLGFCYKNNYTRKKRISNYLDGTIVLIEPSESYPVGHYLVKYDGKWMDPWINLHTDNSIANAKSGFRQELPGKPMYAIIPIV